jgi:methionine aminopeptidase
MMIILLKVHKYADVSSSDSVNNTFMGRRYKHSGDKSDTPYTISDAISDAISKAISDDISKAISDDISKAIDEQAEISYSIEDISFEITNSLVVKKDKILISPLAGYETQELAQKLDLLIEDLQIFCKNNNEGSLHDSTDLNINASIAHKSSNIIELIRKISDSPISGISSNSARLEAKIARLRSLSVRLEILSWGRPLRGGPY